MTSSDRARQAFVTAGAVAMSVGALMGLGILGTAVRDSAHGALAADATLLAPAQGAFRIWSVIYLGLLGYTVWQWLPRNTDSPRERSIGWWAGASMFLNGAWILTAQLDALRIGFALIAGIAVVLMVLVLALGRHPWTSRWEWLLVDGTFGLYLGWILAASFANLAVVGSFTDWPALSTLSEEMATRLLVLSAVLGVALTTVFSGRLAVTLGVAWGLVWIAIGRLTAAPYSPRVGTAAILCAAAVLAGTALTRASLTIRRTRVARVATAPSPAS